MELCLNQWLPPVLGGILAALDGGEGAALAGAQTPEDLLAWERFRLVAPSRLDVPATAAELDAEQAIALLEGLGLASGDPPRRVAHPDPVETVLTLEHEDVRELELLRAAVEPTAPATPLDALPDPGARFGGGRIGRNDPCPCGSGRKFKKCHGA